jgi:tetratricopeptide (TPR) repeat protein
VNAPKPLCFVLMPFGVKPDATGAPVDFDAVYAELIRPAIEEAGLQPIRADEEMTGGIIHKPMFERLLLCEYAVADLTTANANVFYELGVRHATRPRSTVLLFAEGGRLPFDVAPLRAIPYRLGPDGRPSEPAAQRGPLLGRLRAARAPVGDSPVFQLVDWTPGSEVAHTKTDTFREQANYSERRKGELARARRAGVESLRALHAELRPLEDCEAGIVVDLFLSYRAVKAWDDMIALVGEMSPPLREAVMIQEQLALALNRAGRRDEAEQTLLALVTRRGASSETYGILGRVYKDQWEDARNAGRAFLARGLLDKAIDAYLRGFEADWRDAYPGVNAVTLMELRDPPDPRGAHLTPVVRYAVERRIAAGTPDYWDYATLVELAVLARDERDAMESLGKALAAQREVWEPETTARNLRLIREARERRGDAPSWAREIEDALVEAAQG